MFSQCFVLLPVFVHVLEIPSKIIRSGCRWDGPAQFFVLDAFPPTVRADSGIFAAFSGVRKIVGVLAIFFARESPVFKVGRAPLVRPPPLADAIAPGSVALATCARPEEFASSAC